MAASGEGPPGLLWRRRTTVHVFFQNKADFVHLCSFFLSKFSLVSLQSDLQYELGMKGETLGRAAGVAPA